jgi:mannose-6-phosphate isomerase-like protein (cupin superfamily)
MTAEKGFDLETNYLVLADGPAAKRIEVGPDFWQTIEQRDDLAGRLVGIFRYDGDWNSWEVHPDGDEIVLLLSGAVDLVLDEAGREHTVELRERAAAVVPSGVWHTANVLAPGEALHITRGAGTMHKPRAGRRER